MNDSKEGTAQAMVAWKRFRVPEFDYSAFKDIPYVAPKALSAEDLQARLKEADQSVYGAHVVVASEELFNRFQFCGPDRHAVMCILPPESVHLLGRSWAWKIQRALIIDSLDATSAKVLYDWKTPRPMNTRLGPDDGVTLNGAICFVITGNRFADHWLGNRSIVENGWKAGEGRTGFRILGCSDPEIEDFHHTYLAFDWPVPPG